ncbi:hypothetical protein [Methylocella silvestris]|uniref:hypothetical protein n=1 Tax=Methylocella silvestris TaxID=199596 RepID=UPI0015E0677D|nr:hypothetical protein [Methylocella silvestris]
MTNFIGLFLEEEWGGRVAAWSLDLDLRTGVTFEEAIVGNRRIGIGRGGLRDRAAVAAFIVVIIILLMVASRGRVALLRLLREEERRSLLAGRLDALTYLLAMTFQKIAAGSGQSGANGGCGKKQGGSDQNGFLHGILRLVLTGPPSPSRLTAA